jgi:hypothetical protein
VASEIPVSIRIKQMVTNVFGTVARIGGRGLLSRPHPNGLQVMCDHDGTNCAVSNTAAFTIQNRGDLIPTGFTFLTH